MKKIQDLRELYRYLNRENIRIKKINLRTSNKTIITFNNLTQVFTWMRFLERESGEILRLKFRSNSEKDLFSLDLPVSRVKNIRNGETSERVIIELEDEEEIEILYSEFT